MLFIIIFLILFACLIEGPSMVKKKQWKELIIFSLLLLIATIYGIDYSYNLEIMPSPISFLNKHLQPIAISLRDYLESL